MIDKAREYAVNVHGDQKYGSKPYVFHLDGVYSEMIKFVGFIVSTKDLDYDEDEMCATAYLHDTIEDTDVTFEDIEQEFGSNIARMVLSLTHSTHETYGEYIARISHLEHAIIVIKISDLLFNKAQSQKSLKKAKGAERSIIKQRIGKYELAILYLMKEIFR